ncbi:MAG: hypothetical protein PVG27_06960 [Chloroflexota bacterium]|jgi:hypothetical protein
MEDQRRAALLEDLAADASRRRDEFLADAGRQFVRFLDAHRSRLKDLGGLVLIDDEPDYLFVSGEGTFRSRTRYQDENGRWVAETEDIEDGAELVEIFNPADLYAAFVDAAGADVVDAEEVSAATEPEAEPEDAAAEGAFEAEAFEEGEGEGDEGEPGLDEDWLEPVPAPDSRDEAARMLYDLALTFQERSQLREAQLLDDFSVASENLAAVVGDARVADEEDERIWFRASGTFEAEVVPEEDEDGNPVWQTLLTADEFVQFYDPTDLFGDLAEALAEQHPHVAPELADDDANDEV